RPPTLDPLLAPQVIVDWALDAGHNEAARAILAGVLRPEVDSASAGESVAEWARSVLSVASRQAEVGDVPDAQATLLNAAKAVGAAPSPSLRGGAMNELNLPVLSPDVDAAVASPIDEWRRKPAATPSSESSTDAARQLVDALARAQPLGYKRFLPPQTPGG